MVVLVRRERGHDLVLFVDEVVVHFECGLGSRRRVPVCGTGQREGGSTYVRESVGQWCMCRRKRTAQRLCGIVGHL